MDAAQAEVATGELDDEVLKQVAGGAESFAVEFNYVAWYFLGKNRSEFRRPNEHKEATKYKNRSDIWPTIIWRKV